MACLATGTVAAPGVVPLQALSQTYMPNNGTLQTQQPCASGQLFELLRQRVGCAAEPHGGRKAAQQRPQHDQPGQQFEAHAAHECIKSAGQHHRQLVRLQPVEQRQRWCHDRGGKAYPAHAPGHEQARGCLRPPPAVRSCAFSRFSCFSPNDDFSRAHLHTLSAFLRRITHTLC